jgi:hypothetical protein
VSLGNAALLVPGVITNLSRKQEKGIDDGEITGGGIGEGEIGERGVLKGLFFVLA